MRIFDIVATLFIVAGLFVAPSLAAANNIWFVVDSSGSMAGKVDGAVKMTTAKNSLPALMAQVPAGTTVGVIAYGHNRKDDCKDIEIIGLGGPGDVAYFQEKLNPLKPVGKTPIADTLEIIGELVERKYSDTTNSVVLVSDGIETCEGNPCAVAEKLASANISVKTHVIGFDISEKDRKQLECIAEKGQGKYFSADSTEGFSDAVGQAVQLAQIKQEPKKPEYTEIFRDDFDGEELSDHWEIINPNPDAFIVEDGVLIVIADKAHDLKDPEVIQGENFFQLDFEPPKKQDWRMTAKISADFQTIREWMRIGIIDKPDKHISSGIWVNKGTYAWVNLRTAKQTGADETYFDNEFIVQVNHGDLTTNIGESFELQLAKDGRKYTARYRKSGDKNAEWTEAGQVSSLRAKGLPFLYLNQVADDGGETEFHVDWFKIEVPAE